MFKSYRTKFSLPGDYLPGIYAPPDYLHIFTLHM